MDRGAWVAQLVRLPTLDFSSDHDLMVSEIEPLSGSVLAAWSLLEILSLLLYTPLPFPSHALSLSLTQNKLKINK